MKGLLVGRGVVDVVLVAWGAREQRRMTLHLAAAKTISSAYIFGSGPLK